MKRQAQLASLQFAVFVGGGLLAPAGHLAWHQPGHSHGWTVAPDPRSWQESAEPRRRAGPAHRDVRPEETPRHEHPDTHSHPHPHPHRHPPPPPDHGATPAEAEHEPASGAPRTQPIERTHGHGSLAHLGLALLTGPPPLPLPTLRLMGVAPRTDRPLVGALSPPRFPLPRPPPTPVSS